VSAFHTWRFAGGGRVDICEPAPRHHVWLQLYVPSRLRGTGYSSLLIRSVLSGVKGQHYLHFDPAVSSFRSLAKDMGWKYRGWSKWFRRCIAYEYRAPVVRAMRITTPIAHYEVSRRIPRIGSFIDKGHLEVSVAAIEASFRGRPRAA